jgi:hypothetical protein
MGQQIEMHCGVSQVSHVTPVTLKLRVGCVIPGFRREVDKICALLGYNAAYGGNSLPTSSNTKFLELFRCD